jgi:hypothetical protein
MPAKQRVDKSETITEEKGRVTLYISKSVLKRFKHRAIDEDKDLSQLAEETFIALLDNSENRSG